MVAVGGAGPPAGICARTLDAPKSINTETMPNGFMIVLVISKSRSICAWTTPSGADRQRKAPTTAAPRLAAHVAGRARTAGRPLRCAAPTARGGLADCAAAA